MISVLFVCLGNICRSPMAEALFRRQLKDAGLAGKVEVDSAGLGGWHIGQPPHEGTRDKLDEHDIDYSGMKGRLLQEDDLAAFDYIMAMDAENLGAIHEMAGANPTGYVARLLDLVPEEDLDDVPDPFYDGGFDEVYELVEEGCRHLLALIREREGL